MLLPFTAINMVFSLSKTHFRHRLQPRWFSALSNLGSEDPPVMLLWGEDDPVAVMDIPDFLEGIMRGARLTRKTMERTSII